MTAGASSEVRIVVPAYNEELNLPALCERVRAALEGSSAYRIFVVDDGSRDRTLEVARALAASHPLTCIPHGRNRGVGAAFLTGMRAAVDGAPDGDAVVVLEGDGTSDPAVIPAMLRELGSCDVVIASRYQPGGGYKRFPLKRWLLSRAANALLRAVCRLPGVRDYTIFYRAYRAGPLKRALAEHGERFTSVGGFACNAEMLLRLRGHAGRVREVPLVYDYGIKRGGSGMRVIANLGSYLKLFGIFFSGTGRRDGIPR